MAASSRCCCRKALICAALAARSAAGISFRPSNSSTARLDASRLARCAPSSPNCRSRKARQFFPAAGPLAQADQQRNRRGRVGERHLQRVVRELPQRRGLAGARLAEQRRPAHLDESLRDVLVRVRLAARFGRGAGAVAQVTEFRAHDDGRQGRGRCRRREHPGDARHRRIEFGVHQLAELQTAQVGQLRRALRRGRKARRARCRRRGQRAQQALHARGRSRRRRSRSPGGRPGTTAARSRRSAAERWLAALSCLQAFQPHPFAGVGGRGYQADDGVGALDAVGNRRQPYLAAGDVAGVEPAGVAGALQIGDQTVGDLPVATRVADEDTRSRALAWRTTRGGKLARMWLRTGAEAEVAAARSAPAGQRLSSSSISARKAGCLSSPAALQTASSRERECMTRTNTAMVKQAAHASDDEICRGAALRNRVVHVRMLGVKGEGQPGVTTVFAHERSEQIGGLFDDVHSLVVSPERTRCAHSRQVMPTRLAW
jgi:hypothetical protein